MKKQTFFIAITDDMKLLMEESGLKNPRDFFEKSISLFEWAINQKKKNLQIGSWNEKEKFILHDPFLEAISARSDNNG